MALRYFCSILCAALMLSACGQTTRIVSPAKGIWTALKPKPTPATTDLTQLDVDRITQNARKPAVIVHSETSGMTGALIEIARNGDVHTYGSAARQTLSLRGGMVVATRAMGQDLMWVRVSSPPTLLWKNHGGTTHKEMAYLSGSGQTVTLKFTCLIDVQHSQTQTLTYENCHSATSNFENRYLFVSGEISNSRQWVGPAAGYVRLQHVIPN